MKIVLGDAGDPVVITGQDEELKALAAGLTHAAKEGQADGAFLTTEGVVPCHIRLEDDPLATTGPLL